MGYSRPDEEFRADHYRDDHKHELRPGDRGFPVRLEPAQMSPAVEVAIAVKACPNIHAAAGLIEAFVDSERERIRLDAVAAGANP